MKLSFKDYLDSKQSLRESAINNTPKRTATYNVFKYCKIAVGECKEEKHSIPLKPKQKLLVDWLYEDPDNPTPVGIRVEGSADIPVEKSFAAFWQSERLERWLNRNAKEQN